MQKIVEYITIEQDDSFALDRMVNDHIKRGWQPFGGLAVTMTQAATYYTQAMVKYAEVAQ